MSVDIRERLVDFVSAFDLPTLVRRVAEAMGPAWLAVLPADRVRSLQRLVICGCGDSLFAAVSARLALERFSGLLCEPMDALECGRYAMKHIGSHVLVLGISSSGTTSRVLEAIALAGRAGAMTLALTGVAGSALEQMAGGGVVRPVVGAGGREGPTARLERHFGEYIGTLAALFHLALWLGAARGVIGAHDIRHQTDAIHAAAAVAQRTLTDTVPHVLRALDYLGNTDRIFYLGAGPSYGTALFGAAKLVEEVPMCGVPQHLEEWAHLEYFLTMVEGERTRAVVMVPPGDSTDRAAEILRAIREDQGVAIAVTHAREDTVRQVAAATIDVAGDVWEGFTPIAYSVPVQLLGIALAMQRGQVVVPLSRRDRGRLIRGRIVRGVPSA